MALSTTGYTASGAGTGAANGNYVPVVGANATWNGATQYTNGSYFLVWSGSIWYVDSGVNVAVIPPAYSGSGGSVSTMPLTGWTTGGGTAPAPTFVDMSGGGGGGAVVTRRPPIFF